MKKITSFLSITLVLALSITVTSCSPARYVRSSISTSEITDIALIEPLAYVETYDRAATIGHKLETSFNDSLGAAVKAILRESIAGNSDVISVNGYIPLELSVADTLFDYVQMVAPNKDFKANLGIPPSVGDLIRESGHRFALVVSVNGVAPSNNKAGSGMLARQTAAGVGLVLASTILSGGMVTGYVIPIQSRIDMSIIVFDAVNGNIVYFDRFVESDAVNLTQPKYLDRQLRRLLKKCKFPLTPAGPAN